jgi:hypothetical protein
MGMASRDDRGGSVWSAYRMINATKSRRERAILNQRMLPRMPKVKRRGRSCGKVKVPSKLRIFAWRGEVRVHRHITTSPICTVCNADLDTWWHFLSVAEPCGCKGGAGFILKFCPTRYQLFIA